jgi:ribosomal protein S18 acetylase RimI-like enzyme
MVPNVAQRIADPVLARRVMVHEARAQQSVGRELRELGDGWLLHDPADAEPFWNRLVAPTWPEARPAFDRRLDEVVTLFSTLDRLPHIRPLPLGGRPPDLAHRLLEFGFDAVGADRRMVLVDDTPCLALAEWWRRAPLDGISAERHPQPSPPRRRAWALDAALVLAEAFGVDPFRRLALETDVLACVARRGCSVLLLRDQGEPIAVARRATVDGASYLSSIGTRPAWRGRGHGRVATALAVADSLEAGSDLVHLAVDVGNDAAVRFYETLGFALVGDAVPDLLLR